MIYVVLRVVIPQKLADMFGMDNTYYIVNNRYVGYVDFDHFGELMSIMIGRDGWDLFDESTYTPISIIKPVSSEDEKALRKLFCGRDGVGRSLLTEDEAESLLRKANKTYPLVEKTYKVHQPDKNSSRIVLKATDSDDQLEDFYSLLKGKECYS